MTLVFLTGASKGLGHALLKMLLQSANPDLFVLAFSRTEPGDVDATPQYRWFASDFSDPMGALHTFRQASQGLKPSKIVFVNNAASIEPLGSVGLLDEAMLQSAIRINVNTPVAITNWMLATFPAAGLRIVNVSSGAAARPIEGWSQYCASKAFMEMFFGVVAAEAATTGRALEVVNVNPGVMDTGMQQTIRASGIQSKQNERLISLYETGGLQSAVAVAHDIYKAHLEDYI